MPNTHPKFIWFNGAVVPWDEAKVHVSTATVLRGANVFEGVRAYWNTDEHELYIFRNDEFDTDVHIFTAVWDHHRFLEVLPDLDILTRAIHCIPDPEKAPPS